MSALNGAGIPHSTHLVGKVFLVRFAGCRGLHNGS
jgi:hypothetical protein